MKANMGTVDRVARVVLAAAMAGLILAGVVQGAVAIILGVLAAVFVLTSLVSFCPLYAPFGISTCKAPSGKRGA
jgi:predicted ABC-type sugar transport system permease subunit